VTAHWRLGRIESRNNDMAIYPLGSRQAMPVDDRLVVDELVMQLVLMPPT